jgi:hypothetical protein
MPKANPKDVLTLEKKLMLAGVSRDKWWPAKSGEHEVAFALNVYTQEIRWFRGDKAKGDKWKARYYPFPKWITGTADWKGADSTYLIIIDDLKTGAWPVEAENNKQLLTYALPFWVALGSPLDCLIKLSITQWPKYPLAGKPKRNLGVATGLDLAQHLIDLKHALEHPEEMNPEKELCRFCDCRKNCPAFKAAGFDYTKKEWHG